MSKKSENKSNDKIDHSREEQEKIYGITYSA
jgi:hypothetical protein